MAHKLLFSSIFLFLFINLSAQKPKTELISANGKPTKLPYSQMALSAELLGAAVSDTAYFSWCVSPIKYKGQYHLFSSRWPAKMKMAGWTSTDAEIIHLVSDKPEGPFKNVGVVLNSKNSR